MNSFRHTLCFGGSMIVARRFEDLIVWQLAQQLRGLVYQMTKAGPPSKDFKFRDQIRDSACSAPRNMSEGFKRYDPPEFAQYMKIATASITETQNHLLHGRDENYCSDEQFTQAWRVSCRALKAGNRLHAYLRNCPRKKPRKPRGTPENPAEPG
jgi:four helix bundle protein